MCVLWDEERGQGGERGGSKGLQDCVGVGWGVGVGVDAGEEG